MSIKNYSTTRNYSQNEFKGRQVKLLKQPITYKLERDVKIKLSKKVSKFNDWELSFYNSLKFNQYKIVSSKQWEVVKKLIAK